MLSKKIKSVIVMVFFLASSLAIAPNLAQAQGISIPGPTLYLGSVTSTPYTGLSEISSDNIMENNLPYGSKFSNLQLILPLLNGTNIYCGLSSFAVFPSNNTYILVLKAGLRFSNGYPINATALYDQYLISIIKNGEQVYYPSIINSTAVKVYYPEGVTPGNSISLSPSFFFILDTSIYVYPPYWQTYVKWVAGNLTAIANGNNAIRAKLFNYMMNTIPQKIMPPQYPIISAGPYLLSAVTPTEFIYTRNPYYWDEEAYPWNSIVVYQFTSTTAEETYALTGKIDYFDGWFTPSVMKELPYYWITPVKPVLGGNDLVFNCKSDWVSQLEVRQAIIHAINRTAVVAASGMQPYYTTLEYPISYNPWAYSDLGQNFLATLSKYPYNLTKAKELMEAAGYELKQGQWYAANGTPVSLTILASSSTTSGPSLSELEDVESQLKTFGFPTTLLITSNPSYAETGNGFNLYWGSWGWWGPAWEVFIFPAALDNGMAGSYYENFLQPVYVPGVGNVTFIQLFTRVRAGTSNLTQEEVWIKGLAYIENHYVTDIPIDGEAGIYGVNSKDVIWVTNNSQINLIEGGGQIILLEAQLGLLHLPIKSIIVLAPASANIGQPVNITATAYTVNSWVAPATEL
ncbi:MAG: ABC transporter substrate-binding protein, partial [Thermoprotei archaeon]